MFPTQNNNGKQILIRITNPSLCLHQPFLDIRRVQKLEERMVGKVEICLRKWDPWWAIDDHEVVDVFEGVQVRWMYGKQNPYKKSISL